MAVDLNLLNSNSLNNISTNFQRVKDALEDSVSRSGNLPNEMNADLDMDGNDLLNVGVLDVDAIVIDGGLVQPLSLVRLADQVTVLDFGATTASPSNNTAFQAMGAAMGYILVPSGVFPLTTGTINSPIHFQPGGAITGAADQTITITNRVNSERQHIFQGDCTIILNIVNPDGEDSKNAHVSWWGVFPRGSSTEILTSKINRAFTAFTGQNREGIMEFDNGSYRIDGTITIPRGIHLKGSGTRRTIFDLVGGGYTAIQSGGDAIRITGIQFEQPSDAVAPFTGTQIDLIHNDPFLDDISLWNADIGIRVRGNQANIKRVRSVYGFVNPGPATATIWLQGSRATIDDVKVVGTTTGPASIILIGAGNTSSMTQNSILNIQTTEKAVGVNIVADTSGINLTTITNVSFSGESGDEVDSVINVTTSGTAGVRGLIVSGIMSNSVSNSLLKIVQNSSGATKQITMSNSTGYGSGTGIVLTQTAGTLSHITLGDTVNVLEKTAMIAVTGTVTSLQKPTWMV